MNSQPKKNSPAPTSSTPQDDLFQALFAQTQDGVFITDAQGRCLDANPPGCHLLGCTQEKLLALTGPEFPVLAALTENGEQLAELLSGQTGLSQASQLRGRDGRWRPVEINGRPLVDGRWLWVVRDLSERAQAKAALETSQARLTGIIESAMDAIVSVNENMVVVLFNAAAEQMFGCPISEALGQPLDRFLPDRFHNEHQKYIRAFGQTGVTNRTMGALGDIMGRRMDGTEFPIEASISQVEADGSKIYTAILREITGRKQAEAHSQQLNEALEQRVAERTAQLAAANNELEAFAYSVSHDLRAPLRAIDGYTRILEEDYEPFLDAEGRRVCAVVRDEAQRMGQLIDGLLTFSRLSRLEMKHSSINNRQLVDSVLESLSPPTERQQLDLRIAPLPQAMGDPALIRQVWHNLLANALKFSSKRPRAIIEIRGEERENDVLYSVRDNGAGFDMRYADKLFGVFQRLHSEREFEGTGVGLAIIQRIIHRHNGRVWVESEPDQGATFYFTLPRT